MICYTCEEALEFKKGTWWHFIPSDHPAIPSIPKEASWPAILEEREVPRMVPEAPVEPAEAKFLVRVCLKGGHEFNHPAKRGRPPKNCPEHNVKIR